MHEIDVVVTLQVDDEDFHLTDEQAKAACVEAIRDCVNHFAQRVGFQHQFANEVSIGFVDVASTDECEHCGGKFQGLSPAMYCDGEDWNQPECVVHLCEECTTNIACKPGWGWSNEYNDPAEYEVAGEYADGSTKWRRTREYDEFYDERMQDEEY